MNSLSQDSQSTMDKIVMVIYSGPYILQSTISLDDHSPMRYVYREITSMLVFSIGLREKKKRHLLGHPEMFPPLFLSWSMNASVLGSIFVHSGLIGVSSPQTFSKVNFFSYACQGLLQWRFRRGAFKPRKGLASICSCFPEFSSASNRTLGLRLGKRSCVILELFQPIISLLPWNDTSQSQFLSTKIQHNPFKPDQICPWRQSHTSHSVQPPICWVVSLFSKRGC